MKQKLNNNWCHGEEKVLSLVVSQYNYVGIFYNYKDYSVIIDLLIYLLCVEGHYVNYRVTGNNVFHPR